LAAVVEQPELPAGLVSVLVSLIGISLAGRPDLDPSEVGRILAAALQEDANRQRPSLDEMTTSISQLSGALADWMRPGSRWRGKPQREFGTAVGQASSLVLCRLLGAELVARGENCYGGHTGLETLPISRTLIGLNVSMVTIARDGLILVGNRMLLNEHPTGDG
jgi:hypothetical protein